MDASTQRIYSAAIRKFGQEYGKMLFEGCSVLEMARKFSSERSGIMPEITAEQLQYVLLAKTINVSYDSLCSRTTRGSRLIKILDDIQAQTAPYHKAEGVSPASDDTSQYFVRGRDFLTNRPRYGSIDYITHKLENCPKRNKHDPIYTKRPASKLIEYNRVA